MSITVAQLSGAIQTTNQLDSQLQTLSYFLSKVQTVVNNGWQDAVVPGVNIPVTPAQQALIVSSYDALKAQLVTTFNQLP